MTPAAEGAASVEVSPRQLARPLRILLLCDNNRKHARTVLDHIGAFSRYSGHLVVPMNPYYLRSRFGLNFEYFDVLIIHYSLCVLFEHFIPRPVEAEIKAFKGLKVQFIQDEHRWTNRMVAKIAELGVHLLFSCVPEPEIDKIYGSLRRRGLQIVPTLAGYVPENLSRRSVPAIAERGLHVAYRGRELPFWMGALTHEKTYIGREFKRRAPRYGLKSDIAWREEDRIYGKKWVAFLTSTKATLCTESGASITDFDGEVEQRVKAYLKAHPNVGFDSVANEVLAPFEGNVMIKAISPRAFEAASLHSCLVMFPGDYSGVLKAERHYLPLEKDFSNMDEVAARLRDDTCLQEMVDRTYDEIVASGRYSYRAFMQEVDIAVTTEFVSRFPHAIPLASKPHRVKRGNVLERSAKNCPAGDDTSADSNASGLEHPLKSTRAPQGAAALMRYDARPQIALANLAIACRYKILFASAATWLLVLKVARRGRLFLSFIKYCVAAALSILGDRAARHVVQLALTGWEEALILERLYIIAQAGMIAYTRGCRVRTAEGPAPLSLLPVVEADECILHVHLRPRHGTDVGGEHQAASRDNLAHAFRCGRINRFRWEKHEQVPLWPGALPRSPLFRIALGWLFPRSGNVDARGVLRRITARSPDAMADLIYGANT